MPPDHRLPARHMTARHFMASLCAVASACALTVPALTLAGPAGSAAASGSATSPPTTQPLLPLATTTTTAPPASTTTTPTTAAPAPTPPTIANPAPAAPRPAPTPTTRPAATTTTTRPAGVPGVPVGAPPTTPLPPGAKPAPQPDPSAILLQVDQSLDQLAAISDFKPAQALVTAAQSRVTRAGAALLAARQHLQQAQEAQQKAAAGQRAADGQLRQMAVAAYIGVGYSTPGMGQPANGNGDQGPGTVSTPGGLSGIEALDAKEMLVLVGQRTRQNALHARADVAGAMKLTTAASAAYQAAQGTVTAAENNLLASQQTLKLVTAAAVTPGAAAVTPLPDLVAAARTGIAPPLPGTATAASPPTAANAVGGTLTAAPISGAAPTPASPTILGTPVLSGKELAAWYASTGRKANATVPMDRLAADYAQWGHTLGIRDDLAFAQSIVETGYFSFPTGGQLTDKDNNFAGIGACDTCAHGWTFPDASTGVEAQLELLHDYASSHGLPKGVKNVIGGTGVGGCCSTWTKLAGVWASSTVYGISIMTVYERMLTWVIPQREVSVGLIAPTAATPQGPELAPLPGAPKPTTTTTTKAANSGNGATSPVTVSAAAAGRAVRSH